MQQVKSHQIEGSEDQLVIERHRVSEFGYQGNKIVYAVSYLSFDGTDEDGRKCFQGNCSEYYETLTEALAALQTRMEGPTPWRWANERHSSLKNMGLTRAAR